MRMEKIRLQPIVALANPRPTDYYEVLADAHATIPLELFLLSTTHRFCSNYASGNSNR